MSDVEFKIGGSAEDMGRGFVEAWERGEAGDLTPARPVVTFESWAASLSVFSDGRLALLRRSAGITGGFTTT